MSSVWLKRALIAAGTVLALVVIFEFAESMATTGSKTAPNFSGADVNGKPWSLADYRGHQPVIVDFFATWCGPCQMEWPELEELARKHQDHGLKVVAVSDEPADTLNQFPKYRSSPLTVIADGASAAKAYGVNGIPHTFFFNAHGDLVDDVEGYDPERLKEAVSKLKL